MNLEKLNDLHPVIARYPDRSKFGLTVGELKSLMDEEPTQWKQYFFQSLADRGMAYGPIATYHLTDHQFLPHL